MLSSPRNPPWNRFRPLVVLLVHPKGESETLLNDPLQKIQIARVARIGLAPLLAVDLEHPPGRPGLNGWIRIIEFPFVCRELSIGVHVPPERVDELNYQWNAVRWVNVVPDFQNVVRPSGFNVPGTPVLGVQLNVTL